MALRILRRRSSPGSLVQAILLPQHLPRTELRAFATYGRIGAVMERFRTRLLPLLTRLTRQISTPNIFLQCQREPGAQLPRLADGRTMDRLCRLRPSRPLGTVSLVGMA